MSAKGKAESEELVNKEADVGVGSPLGDLQRHQHTSFWSLYSTVELDEKLFAAISLDLCRPTFQVVR